MDELCARCRWLVKVNSLRSNNPLPFQSLSND